MNFSFWTSRHSVGNSAWDGVGWVEGTPLFCTEEGTQKIMLRICMRVFWFAKIKSKYKGLVNVSCAALALCCVRQGQGMGSNLLSSKNKLHPPPSRPALPSFHPSLPPCL